MIEIDLAVDGKTPDYDQTIEIDGALFRLRALYSVRRKCWTISLYTESGDALIEGQAVVLGVNLLHRCVVRARPLGNLFVASYSEALETPGLTNLGPRQTYRLIYAPIGEVAP